MSIEWNRPGPPLPGNCRVHLFPPAGHGPAEWMDAPDLRRCIAMAWKMYGDGHVSGVAVLSSEKVCYCALPPFGRVDGGRRVGLILATYPAPDAREIGGES
jgi:hypothetical protein